MERNQFENREKYYEVLLPLLKKKLEYIHCEGIAHIVWSLSNA